MLLALALLACGPTDEPDCVTHAVVTDIDETLTTSNDEWVAQLMDPEHDPAMRPDADTLMRSYADLGYAILYVTARGEEMTLSDGRSAREATEDWLVAHDFPMADGALFLSPDTLMDEDETIAYKQGVLEDHAAEGWALDWAYGNAETDIIAFQNGGMADDTIFLVGELAGTMGVQAIDDASAYTAHLAHLDTVPNVSCVVAD